MTDPARADKAHIRIANRQFEAILDSTMSDRQKVICYALLRVTVGWHQATARLTHEEFADIAGMNAGGTFRGALKELEREGVIVITVPGGAGQPNEYRLNPDFTQWGKFSVAPERLRRLHGKRPKGDATAARTQAEAEATPAQGQAVVPPTSGQDSRPPVGEGTGSNPLPELELDLRKDMKDSESTTNTNTLQNGEKGQKPPQGPHARRVAHTDLERLYDSERAAAARRWADDPANADRLRQVEDAAKSACVLDIASFVGKRAYESERDRRIAEIIAFPSKTAWKAARPTG